MAKSRRGHLAKPAQHESPDPQAVLSPRYRWKPSPECKEALERVFLVDKNPALATREALAAAFGINPYQVKIWFQNARARDRQAGGHSPLEAVAAEAAGAAAAHHWAWADHASPSQPSHALPQHALPPKKRAKARDEEAHRAMNGDASGFAPAAEDPAPSVTVSDGGALARAGAAPRFDPLRSPECTEALEQLFRTDPYASSSRERKESMAEQFGISVHQVGVWFQNRRARAAREAASVNGGGGRCGGGADARPATCRAAASLGPRGGGGDGRGDGGGGFRRQSPRWRGGGGGSPGGPRAQEARGGAPQQRGRRGGGGRGGAPPLLRALGRHVWLHIARGARGRPLWAEPAEAGAE